MDEYKIALTFFNSSDCPSIFLQFMMGLLIIMTMNEMQKEKNIRYWIETSNSDLLASKAIAQLAKKNAQALFFLHLSIEKALKALFVFVNSEFAPLSHNLLMLAAKSNLVWSTEDMKLLSEINDFNLQTRYPNEVDEMEKLATDGFTEFYLREGSAIQKWILEKLK